MPSVTAALEEALAPLDRARAAFLRALGPALCRWLVVPREARVAVVGAGMGIFLLALAASYPLWLLALSPLVLGVPHIVADVRYLVMRPGYHRRPLLVVLVAAALVAAVAGLQLRGALLAAGLALLVARAPLSTRLLGLGALAGCFALVQATGWWADALFVHLHNFVALALWWVWRRRQTRLHLVPLAVFALGFAFILGGGAEQVAGATGGLEPPFEALDADHLETSLAPMLGGPWALRAVLLYAYAQALHYLVWLRLVPEEDRPSPRPRSFRQSYRALLQDVGPAVLVVAAVTMLGLAAWATRSVALARHHYLQIAFFHTYLEVVAFVLLCSEGRCLPSEGSERA